MSETLLEEYLAARRTLEAVAVRAAATVERVRRAATMLEGDWRDVAVLARELCPDSAPPLAGRHPGRVALDRGDRERARGVASGL